MVSNASDAINKHFINTHIFWENTEKIIDSAMIIPLNKKQLINYFDETLNVINEKAYIKNRQPTKSENENFLDRQNVEEIKMK